MIADTLANEKTYHMLNEEPLVCAETMYAVLESLRKLRSHHPEERERNGGTNP